MKMPFRARLLKTSFRSKHTFSHPEHLFRAAAPPFNLSGRKTECMKLSRGWGWGDRRWADHQRVLATMLRRCSQTKAQSCSGDTLLLRFHVAAGRLPAWTQHKHNGSWRVAAPGRGSSPSGGGPNWWDISKTREIQQNVTFQKAFQVVGVPAGFLQIIPECCDPDWECSALFSGGRRITNVSE